MRYLFYDLEDATSKNDICKICEFGYVLTNEKFEVIKKGNLIINPNISRQEWDWYVVRNVITRSVSTYEHCKTFDYFYKIIRDLILGADYVIGHTLNADASAINDDCKRYNLPSIDYEFYDIREFYKTLTNTTKNESVVHLLELLGIEGDTNTHDAEADAYNTMLETKAILERANKSLVEMIALSPDSKDTTENYTVKSIEKQKELNALKLKQYFAVNDAEMTYWQRKKLYEKYLKTLHPNLEGGKLKNKKVSISINYEETHFRQILNFAKLIADQGGIIVGKATTADIFVKYDLFFEDGTLRKDSRLNYVNEAINKGSNIKIIKLDDLLDMLGLTEEELEKLPMPI